MSTGGSGTPINKPLGHLDSTYFPSATSSHMSRTVFLNGTYKTYFGSGQSPDGMTGSINRGGYQKPVDWNKANTLLRAPQQVWLAADIAINLNVQISNFSYTGHGPLEAPVLLSGSSAWADGTSNTRTNDLSTGIITQTGPDGQPKPFVRVNQAFLDAQTKINTLRAGLTFVDVINYVNYYKVFQGSFYDNPAYPNPQEPAYMDGPGYYYASPNNVSLISNYTYDQWSPSPYPNYSYLNLPPLNGGCMPWVTAPDPTEKFFGTDFLHIYCSGGNYLLTSPSPFSGYFILPDPGTVGSVIPPYFELSDPNYLSSRARIIGSYPKFAGFNVRLFNVGPEGNTPGEQYSAYQETHTDPDFLTYSTYETTGCAVAANYNASNAQLGNWLGAIAGDLSAYGYQYGGASEQLTADGIVKMIADQFNFDPQTGLDLPLPSNS